MNTCFGTLGAAVWRAVRPVRVEKKVGKKVKIKKKFKKPQVVYISSHRPQRIDCLCAGRRQSSDMSDRKVMVNVRAQYLQTATAENF